MKPAPILAVALTLLALTGCAARPSAGRAQTVSPPPAATMVLATATPTLPPDCPADASPTPTSTVFPLVNPAAPSQAPSLTEVDRNGVSTARPAYFFHVWADPIRHQASVRMELRIHDPLRLATGELVFNVPANHAPGIFALDRVSVNGAVPMAGAALLDTVLRVPLDDSVDVSEPVTLSLDYRLTLPPATTAGISGAHALAWSEIGDVYGYWYPVVAPWSAEVGWRTIPYHPVGDPIAYEASDYAVTVEAPDGYSVIGSGADDRSGAIWRFRISEARGFALIVSDKLEMAESTATGRRVTVFHQPAHQGSALAVLTAADEALPLFEGAFGPYPYPELVVVEAEQFGGMEYSGLITFSSAWFAQYAPPTEGAAFGADYLIRFVVHEIGHQWWYGGVGNDQATEPWLDESLARFSEWLYYAELHPEHLAWWESPSIAMPTIPIDGSIYDYADTDAYVHAVYVSGTRFMLDLQTRMGQDAYLAFLQRFYLMHRGHLVTAEEFIVALGDESIPGLDELVGLYFAGRLGQTN